MRTIPIGTGETRKLVDAESCNEVVFAAVCPIPACWAGKSLLENI